MKSLQVLGFATLLVLLISERVVAQTSYPNGARVVRGSLAYVLCGESVHVRDESLANIAFSAEPFERITPYQGWGQNKKSYTVDGTTYTFVKVEFIQRREQQGWVAEQYVKLRSECAGAELPEVSSDGDPLNGINGLDDPRCCFFPIENRPSFSYLAHPAKFGAVRKTKNGGRRTHAATDLYTGLYKNIRAVAPGKVIYDPIYFYMETYEFAVVHPGGFVVRYGEIAPSKLVRGIEKNAHVRTGQVIAKVGQTLDKGRKVAHPMLHLEVYQGTSRGSLSTKGAGRGYYYRRSDLMNPTKYVQSWEKKTFRL